MRVAVLGAAGFIGRRLVPALAAAGHDVVAAGRRLRALPSGDRIEPAEVDVGDTDALRATLEGVGCVYYLVHSMAGDGFEKEDARLASSVARAAREAGVGRIVYLGALGRDAGSRHLSSRREVGRILASTGVPLVELRAAVILGAGSISFEMLRYLVERLPMMICPRWVRTRIEPVALSDVMMYLLRSTEVPAGAYEIGCGEVTSYRELMDVYARARRLRQRVILDVPMLTLRLSSYWVDLVTPVDRRISHALIESLSSEVVVEDAGTTAAAFGLRPTPLAQAMTEALDDQRREVSEAISRLRPGLSDGVYVVRRHADLAPGSAAEVRAHLARIGGSLGWYGIALLWRLRLLAGRLLGERDGPSKPARLERGAEVDWWVAETVEPDGLVLRSRAWRLGDAWLAFLVGGSRLTQVAAFRPRGVVGFLYWKALRPLHAFAFARMMRHISRGGRA